MKQRRRIYYSAVQRSEIWDRWQAGESMSSIGRRFDRESSSVFSVISPTGGIRPPDRHRAKQALSLSKREEISRWLSMRRSLRSSARHLGRSASTGAARKSISCSLSRIILLCVLRGFVEIARDHQLHNPAIGCGSQTEANARLYVDIVAFVINDAKELL